MSEASVVRLRIRGGRSIEFVVDEDTITSRLADEGHASTVGRSFLLAGQCDCTKGVFAQILNQRVCLRCAPRSPLSIELSLASGPEVEVFDASSTQRIDGRGGRVDEYWLFKRVGELFSLACHEGASLGRSVSSLSVEMVEPVHNIVLSSETASWCLLWDDDWLFVEHNVLTE